jgi:hypothetical protein
MGLMICREHGSHGIKYVCPHIRDAVKSESPCPGIERLEHYDDDDPDIVWAAYYCPACITKYHLPPSGPLPDPDGFMKTVDEMCKAMCPICFEEWQCRDTPRR